MIGWAILRPNLEKMNISGCTYMNVTDGLDALDANEYGKTPATIAKKKWGISSRTNDFQIYRK
jgi:hypothetical protein